MTKNRTEERSALWDRTLRSSMRSKGIDPDSMNGAMEWGAIICDAINALLEGNVTETRKRSIYTIVDAAIDLADRDDRTVGTEA